MIDEQFSSAFSKALLASIHNNFAVAADPYQVRKGLNASPEHLASTVKQAIQSVARRLGFVRHHPESMLRRSPALSEIISRADGLGNTYRWLGDDESRAVLIAVLAHRALGPSHVRLPRDGRSYQLTIDQIDQDLVRERHSIPISTLDGFLNRYDLAPRGFPIAMHAHPVNILTTYALQQYRYSNGETVVGAKPGDVVLDGGGCWGDTALYFAHLVGAAGRVISFEFIPDNLRIFEMNMALNPALTDRVQTRHAALWDRSGEVLSFVDAGPGSRISSEPEPAQCLAIPTTSIDDVVTSEGLERVDFIKLDIEGAELRALEGAVGTLRRFRPTLAIALYHRLDDFVTIPRFLRELDLDYDFFLDHFTNHVEETVLFARPKKRP